MNVRTIYRTVPLSVYYAVSLCLHPPAGWILQRAFSVAVYVPTCLTALGLSRKKQIADYVIFALSGPVHVHVSYDICVSRRKWRKIDIYTLGESRVWVCVCVCERERERWGLRKYEKTFVYVLGREREREGQRNGQPRCYFLGQAVRQQGGIITEAVTFLWFLWFQHEAGGRLWLTHRCTLSAWKLPARGQYMTFLGHFNLRHINYRTVTLCIFRHISLRH